MVCWGKDRYWSLSIDNMVFTKLPQANAVPAMIDSSYSRLDSPGALLQVFETLQRQQSVMTLRAEAHDASCLDDTGGRPCGMGLLSRIDADQQQLALDVSGALQPLPTQVLAVAHLPGGLLTQWVMQAQWTQQAGGGWLLEAPWPAQVLQHQRRRYPRVPLPLGQYGEARFMFGQRPCVLHVEDLSAGGVALRGSRSETAMLFMGRKIPMVVLNLGDGVQIQVDLTVRSRRSYRSFLLGELVVVGCSLEGLTQEQQATLERIMAERLN